MEKFFKLLKEYVLNLWIALKGGHIKKWKVFYIGENGVRQLTFSEFNFIPTPVIFMRAERVPGKEQGTYNDSFDQMKLDEENMIAIYCKNLT
jgi:hypothetical protein